MLKIVLIAVVCSFVIVYLKSINSELVPIVIVASGVILISFSLEYLSNIFTLISQIVNLSELNSDIYKLIFKITSIGIIVEFGAGTINDFGLNGLADKLVLVGKIIILSMSLPIVYSLINLLIRILQ